MGVFGHPGDHAELVFDDVRVPAGNMILGEGRGFEIAQGRLGPGRIHHCMRSIGQAEMALSAIIFRIRNRFAFGSMLEEKDSIRQVIAEARIQLTMCRSLCYLAAVIAERSVPFSCPPSVRRAALWWAELPQRGLAEGAWGMGIWRTTSPSSSNA